MLWLFSPHAANIDSNEPNIILVNATEHACLGQNYDIKCLHPAIDSTLNGRKVFSTSAPNWRVNGKVLLIEEIYSIKYSGKYETVLSITLNKYHFNNGQYFRYSCFLQLFNGDILESNQLEVQPLGIIKNIIHLKYVSACVYMKYVLYHLLALAIGFLDLYK